MNRPLRRTQPSTLLVAAVVLACLAGVVAPAVAQLNRHDAREREKLIRRALNDQRKWLAAANADLAKIRVEENRRVDAHKSLLDQIAAAEKSVDAAHRSAREATAALRAAEQQIATAVEADADVIAAREAADAAEREHEALSQSVAIRFGQSPEGRRLASTINTKRVELEAWNETPDLADPMRVSILRQELSLLEQEQAAALRQALHADSRYASVKAKLDAAQAQLDAARAAARARVEAEKQWPQLEEQARTTNLTLRQETQQLNALRRQVRPSESRVEQAVAVRAEAEKKVKHHQMQIDMLNDEYHARRKEAGHR